MKPLLPFICLLTFACNTRQTNNAETPKAYSDTSTLYYKGTPLFVFNESIDKLIARPSFYQDTTNRQGGGYSYLTIDTFFSARQSTGTMIGSLYIETDNLRNIQRVYGHWAISVQMNDKTKQEAIDSIKQKFFPNMPQNFLLTKADTIRHKNYIEEFKFYPSPDSGDIEHGFVPHWSFVYEARRSQNGL
jgi:hypothetical protein